MRRNMAINSDYCVYIEREIWVSLSKSQTDMTAAVTTPSNSGSKISSGEWQKAELMRTIHLAAHLMRIGLDSQERQSCKCSNRLLSSSASSRLPSLLGKLHNGLHGFRSNIGRHEYARTPSLGNEFLRGCVVIAMH